MSKNMNIEKKKNIKITDYTNLKVVREKEY